MRNVLAIVIVLVLTATTAHAERANFWINGSGTSAGSQGVGMLAPGSGTGYIWGDTDGDGSIVNLALNLVSGSDALTLTAINVMNPVINPSIGFPPKELVRYEFDSAGNVLPEINAITGFGGFSVTNSARIGAGYGDGTGSGAGAGFLDPFYDAANDAFLIASFEYTATGSIDDHANAGLWLQIGQNGLNYAGGRSADVEVVFGSPNDPPLNGETDRLVNSATPDAAMMIPEPSTLILASLALLALLGLIGLGRRSR